MNLSFIAKPEWSKIGENGKPYPVRLTSRVRGKEIAEFLGAEYSENGTSRNDIRIFLKPRSLDSIKDGDYIDLLDEIKIIDDLKKRPRVKVITMSKVQHDYLKKVLKNKLTLIPHHHINIENKTKSKKRSKTLVGGIIGKPVPIVYSFFSDIKQVLTKEGIELKGCFDYQTRQDIVDFHSQIDFQIIWFPDQAAEKDRFYRHPTKIINAASFGIPTIAQDILGHQEFDGDYIKAGSYEEIAQEAVKLKDNRLYKDLSERLIERAKEYHISQIAQLYQQLT